MAGSARVPRTQVFYSQLQYVVGYNGVESFAATLDDGRTERQFGYPIAAYVETFDGARPGTIETGLFAAESAGEWTPAAEATYVVGSDAGARRARRSSRSANGVPPRRSPPTTADERSTGETVRSRSFDTDSAAATVRDGPRALGRSRRPDRGRRAPRRQTGLGRRRGGRADDRGGGRGRAANTTVVVPPGTYEETLTVNESVTIAGEDAQISGDGDGSVITVRAPDVALTGLAVDGSGGQTRDPEAAREGRADDGGVNGFGRRRGVGHQHPTRLRSRRCRDPRDRRTGTRRRRDDGRGERERAAPPGALTRSSATSESTGRIAGRTASWGNRAGMGSRSR